MTYENRLPINYAFGTLSQAAAISDTTLTSTDFAAGLPAGLSTTTYVPLTLQDPSTAAFEIVWVNAHTASATTATVLRAREGTAARAWGSGTLWAVAPTLRDGLLPVPTRAALPTDPHVGLRAFIQDEQVTTERTLAQGWISTLPSAGAKAHLRQTVVQPIPNNAWTPVPFDTEDWDIPGAGGHDPATNPSRYTVQLGWAGKYILLGATAFEANPNGGRGAAWAKNGQLYAAGQAAVPANIGGVPTIVAARGIEIQLAVGDYVELFTYQNAGGPVNSFVAGSAQPSMTVRYDGP